MSNDRSILEAALAGYELRRDNIVGHIAEIQAELRERGGGGGGGNRLIKPPELAARIREIVAERRGGISPKRTLSQETRANMARAQRKRWRLAKRERAASA